MSLASVLHSRPFWRGKCSMKVSSPVHEYSRALSSYPLGLLPVIVDAIISDSNAIAREFWLKSFKTKEGSIRDSVPWKDFVKVCYLDTWPTSFNPNHFPFPIQGVHQVLQHSAAQEDNMEGLPPDEGASSCSRYAPLCVACFKVTEIDTHHLNSTKCCRFCKRPGLDRGLRQRSRVVRTFHE